MTVMNGYWWGFGGLFMLLFWVLVIAGIVWLVLAVGRPQPRSADGPSAASGILEERLARGEIDAEEFRARRGAIEEAVR